MFKTIVMLLWIFSIWRHTCMVDSHIHHRKESVFDYDYCEIKCGNITHTMCNQDEKNRCEPFEYFLFSKEYKNRTFFQILIEGHNGLRSRVAEKMNVTNMIELTWDTRLAAMAQNYLFKCERFGVDPCAAIPNVILEEDVMTEFYKENKSLPQISQNSYYEKSDFYPYKFLERMIREWYFEKESMSQPQVKGRETMLGRLSGENNFTHFAYPLSHRFGCAMSKFDGAYHVVCNYFPYHRTITNVMTFLSGKPVSGCPTRFPLRDIMFSNLCTTDVSGAFDSANNIVYQNSLLFVSFLTIQCAIFKIVLFIMMNVFVR